LREQQTSCGNSNYESFKNTKRVENINNNPEDQEFLDKLGRAIEKAAENPEFMQEIGRAIAEGVMDAIAEKTEETFTAAKDSLRKKFQIATVVVTERVRTSIQASIIPNQISIALLISFTVSYSLVWIFKKSFNNKEK